MDNSQQSQLYESKRPKEVKTYMSEYRTHADGVNLKPDRYATAKHTILSQTSGIIMLLN